MADRTLSIYDAKRGWLGSWTIPPKVRALDVLRDMLASVRFFGSPPPGGPPAKT